MDYLSTSSLSGTVANSASGLSISDVSVVMSGISYFSFSDTATVTRSGSFSGNAFTFSGSVISHYYNMLWYRVITCGNYYYPDSSNNYQSCLGCHVTCQTCTSGGVSDCLTCDTTRNLNTGVCTCKSGYYEANLNACPSCATTCSTCNIAAANCTACRTVDNRELIYGTSGANDQCLCKTGFYDSGITVCQTCTATCFKCNNTAT